MNAVDASAMETQSIVVDYDLPYPPEKVWRALTEPELLAAWLMQNDIKPQLEDFKKQIIALQAGGIEFVEMAVPLGKIDPGPTIDALLAAQPDAIFNAEFGTDLVRLVREVNTRGAFKGKTVVSTLTGQPEYLDTLQDETPEGWIVTGYPWQSTTRSGPPTRTSTRTIPAGTRYAATSPIRQSPRH